MKPKTKPTKQQLVRESWLRGRLGYKLHLGQQLIRAAYDQSKNQLFVGECARQFGKTVFEAVIALEKAFSKPKAKVKIGTAFHTDLLEFILPAFDFVMSDCPQDLRPIYKVQGSKFILRHNKSEIKLVGLDRKPNGLRGTVIDLIILSEAGFISNLHYLFKSVIIPATTHRPDCRVVMLSTPPETPAHEFLDYVQKAEYEGGYIKLTIYDNPLLDQATIERLMAESGGAKSTTWLREYLCEHVTDENLAIICEWNDKYVQEIPKDDYYPFYHKYSSMDLGVKHKTAAIFGHYDFLRAALIIEDEWYMNGPELTTDIIQKEVKMKELELWVGLSRPIKPSKEEEKLEIERLWAEQKPNLYRRLSDNNNPLLLQDLGHLHKIHFTPTDKGTLEEMTNTARIMAGRGQIIVHPRCKQLKGCLKYGVWDKRREKFAESKVYGHFDALAALIYLVRNLNKVTNPIPATFQLDHNNQIYIPKTHQSEGARDLKQAFGLKR